MPMSSVEKAHSRTATIMKVIVPCPNDCVRDAKNFDSRERTAVTMRATKAAVPANAHKALPTFAWLMLTRASKHHAVASSTAAQHRDMRPSDVSCIRKSARIRASTGKAVTDIATPRNKEKDEKGTSE